MRHPDDLLSAYVDGALQPRTATEVAAHLAQCYSCRQVVTDLQALRRLLAATRVPDPPPELLAELLRTDGRVSRSRHRRTWLPVAVALAAVATLVLGGVPRLPASDQFVEELRDHARLAARMPLGDPAAAFVLAALLEQSARQEP